MNLEKARFNMVEQQIRPWDVLDTDVLDLLMAVKREDFVPEAHQALAFADIEIPLGNGASMLHPKIEAKMLQSLQVKKSDKVLEIGAGSGFLTALLATKADQVHALEIVPALADMARKNLDKAGIVNATVETGNGAHGAAAKGPFDVIVFGASLPTVPADVLAQLKTGGRLFAVVGVAPCMSAQLITCTAPGLFETVPVFETTLPALTNAVQGERFVF